MSTPKKPARKRKAAKPVMAWAVVSQRNEISVWAIEYTRADVIKQCDPGPGERIARVRIVEVQPMSRVSGRIPARIKPLTANTRGGWFYVIDGKVEICLEDHDGNVLQGRIPIAMIERRAKGGER